jgi:hypothetical protein
MKFCQEKSTYILPMYHGFLEKKQLFSSQRVFKTGKYLKICCAHSKTPSVIRFSISKICPTAAIEYMFHRRLPFLASYLNGSNTNLALMLRSDEFHRNM